MESMLPEQRATSYANDRARFNIAVHCDGLHGADLKTCSTPFQTAQASERDAASSALAAALTACSSRASDCAGKCSATP